MDAGKFSRGHVAVAECVLAGGEVYYKAQAVFTNCEFDVRESPDEEEPLAEAVVQNACRAVIVGLTTYTGPLYDALAASSPEGSIIARFGVGHEGVDKRQAASKNIVVTNTPGVLNASVAEGAMWLMGAVARHVIRHDKETRQGRFDPHMGAELAGRTLVVLGFGPIGQRVAKTASLGFGMNVIAVDIRFRDQLETSRGESYEDLARECGLAGYVADADDVLPDADVISVHLAATDATRHYINAEWLSRVKPGAILINSARGSLVDESALFDALQHGPLAAAGIDVFETEPYMPVAPGKDLRMLENVVLSPHTGSNTVEANARMGNACLENIRHFFAGRMHELTTVS